MKTEETKTKKSEKTETKKPRQKKTKWITFILYPDNRYHMRYLDWIKKNDVGFYIQHDPDDEGQRDDDKVTKAHYHVAVYRDVQRTASAFIKNLPTVDYYVEERDENGKPVKLSSIVPDDAKKSDIVTQSLIGSAQNVNDIYALAHYFIHDNFKCDYLGKKKYPKDDVKMLNCSRDIYEKNFSESHDCIDSEKLALILGICRGSSNKDEVIEKVLGASDERLVSWFLKNQQFVLNWIWKKDNV